MSDIVAGLTMDASARSLLADNGATKAACFVSMRCVERPARGWRGWGGPSEGGEKVRSTVRGEKKKRCVGMKA